LVADAHNISLDSHVRYLSGLLLGIGIGFWSMVPRIEAMSDRCHLLTAIVFIGGLARLAGLVFDGVPSTPMVLAIGMELAVTPCSACGRRGSVAHDRAPAKLDYHGRLGTSEVIA
jgi:hypothetical protein